MNKNKQINISEFMIIADMKMSDVVHYNYKLLPIINRFGIQLGYGDSTVDEVCKEYKVETNFFLLIINTYLNKHDIPKEFIPSFPMKMLLEYIQEAHKYYINVKVPELAKLIDQLSLSDKQDDKTKSILNSFFKEYQKELEEHIQNEEDEVIPYILSLINAYEKNELNETIISAIEENSIVQYERDHTDVEEKLLDLKNIIIKYIPPAENSHLKNTILIELFRLEEDLNDHARIENNVLIPKVKSIEKELKRLIK